mmetsp:Transcript_33128/g.76530  ORF Transcript_33128/g.76530 Transcript_33128/m.76530 type:complete len:127 (+) Transcript_33128:395-775(+)
MRDVNGPALATSSSTICCDMSSWLRRTWAMTAPLPNFWVSSRSTMAFASTSRKTTTSWFSMPSGAQGLAKTSVLMVRAPVGKARMTGPQFHELLEEVYKVAKDSSFRRQHLTTNTAEQPRLSSRHG